MSESTQPVKEDDRRARETTTPDRVHFSLVVLGYFLGALLMAGAVGVGAVMFYRALREGSIAADLTDAELLTTVVHLMINCAVCVLVYITGLLAILFALVGQFSTSMHKQRRGDGQRWHAERGGAEQKLLAGQARLEAAIVALAAKLDAAITASGAQSALLAVDHNAIRETLSEHGAGLRRLEDRLDNPDLRGLRQLRREVHGASSTAANLRRDVDQLRAGQQQLARRVDGWDEDVAAVQAHNVADLGALRAVKQLQRLHDED